MLVDPDGRQLWKPEVLEDKTVKYVPEEGDNEKTLASQYGLTSAEAKELVKNGAEDGSISGAVAKKVTGSSILQLDVRDASVTSDDINRQAAFAINYENALDIEMVGDFEGDLDDYFSYRSFSDGSSSGLNTSKSNPTSVEIGGEKMNISIDISSSNDGRFSTSPNGSRNVEKGNAYDYLHPSAYDLGQTKWQRRMVPAITIIDHIK